MKCNIFSLFLTLILFGCGELTQRQKEQPRKEQSSSAPRQVAASHSEEKRFVFPTKSSPFPESSVALDTTTGQLCKTYKWKDSAHDPGGLPLCSDLSAGAPLLKQAFGGAQKAYKGFTYTFDGTKWIKGNRALNFDKNGQAEQPWSDDQYDPLNLYAKEEKAKMTLTEAQIRKVADQFGVAYEEAREEAKQQGYQVPPKL